MLNKTRALETKTIDSAQLIPGQPELDIQTLAKILLNLIATKGSIDYNLFQLTILETLGILHSDINEPTNAPMLTSLCQSIPSTLDQTNLDLYADIKKRTKVIHTQIFTEIETQLKEQYQTQKSRPESNKQNLEDTLSLFQKITKFIQAQNEAEVILKLSEKQPHEASNLAYENINKQLQLIVSTMKTATIEDQELIVNLLSSIISTNQNIDNLPNEVKILKALFPLIEAERQESITDLIQEITDTHKTNPTNSMSFDTLSNLFQ